MKPPLQDDYMRISVFFFYAWIMMHCRRMCEIRTTQFHGTSHQITRKKNKAMFFFLFFFDKKNAIIGSWGMCSYFFAAVILRKKNSNTFDVGCGMQHIKRPIEHRNTTFTKVTWNSHTQQTEDRSSHTDYAEGSIHLMYNAFCPLLVPSRHS